jgi:transcriptional regulator with XRE-family HTH domain
MPKDNLKKVLSHNLRLYREEIGISQEELADQCGVHRTYIGSVERCERNVTLATLERFARALQIGVPELLTRKERKNGL